MFVCIASISATRYTRRQVLCSCGCMSACSFARLKKHGATVYDVARCYNLHVTCKVNTLDINESCKVCDLFKV